MSSSLLPGDPSFPFVGRDRELATLRDRLATAIAGSGGQNSSPIPSTQNSTRSRAVVEKLTASRSALSCRQHLVLGTNLCEVVRSQPLYEKHTHRFDEGVLITKPGDMIVARKFGKVGARNRGCQIAGDLDGVHTISRSMDDERRYM